MQIPVVRNILEANARIAADLKAFFAERGILVLNLMSSPGAGKTSLLERTLTDLGPELRMAVIEGDLQTDNDARRVAATGAQAVQINTEGGCHLTSSQVQEALKSLDLAGLDILFIENVGNLVCPAEFDVGEDRKSRCSASPRATTSPRNIRSCSIFPPPCCLTRSICCPTWTSTWPRPAAMPRPSTTPSASSRSRPAPARASPAWYDWLRARLAAKRGA